MCTLLYITPQKKETNHFQYISYFVFRTTYVEFQASTTIIPQGNLTSDCELKQHIWQWKEKEDCSRSEVLYVILIIWMTVATTQNKALLFHLSAIIFWQNPTTPSCTCLTLARFIQLSWQKLGFCVCEV
jgi:hypothetical protein